MTIRRVIVDLDPGTDDAWALAILLKAEESQMVKIEAITIVAGNTKEHHGVNNVVRILEAYGRTDIPVFRGAVRAFIEMGSPEDGPPFHGADGFGDLEWETPPNLAVVRSERAPIEMERLVSKYPKQISLICGGPLTNVALAIKLFPHFADNVKEIHIMGGNYDAVGNTRSRCTEFNFFVDTEAAHTVFQSLKCPITLMPLETGKKATPIELSWRFNVIGIIDHPIVHLMNPVEDELFLSKGLVYWPLYDTLMVAAWMFSEKVIRRQVMRNCEVELHGHDTRGMVAIDHQGLTVPNVNVIELVNNEKVKEVLLWTVSPATAEPNRVVNNEL